MEVNVAEVGTGEAGGGNDDLPGIGTGSGDGVEVVECQRQSIEVEREFERALVHALKRSLGVVVTRGAALMTLFGIRHRQPTLGWFGSTEVFPVDPEDADPSAILGLLASYAFVAEKVDVECGRIVFREYAIEPIIRIYRTLAGSYPVWLLEFVRFCLVQARSIEPPSPASFITSFVDETRRAREMFLAMWTPVRDCCLAILRDSDSDGDGAAQRVMGMAEATVRLYDDFVTAMSEKTLTILDMNRDAAALRAMGVRCGEARGQLDAGITQQLTEFSANIATRCAQLRAVWPTNPTPKQLTEMRAQLEEEKSSACQALRELFAEVPVEVEDVEAAVNLEAPEPGVE